jgi:hypothetical protein
MKNGGVKIIAGYTVIEIKNKLNTFTAGIHGEDIRCTL